MVASARALPLHNAADYSSRSVPMDLNRFLLFGTFFGMWLRMRFESFDMCHVLHTIMVGILRSKNLYIFSSD